MYLKVSGSRLAGLPRCSGRTVRHRASPTPIGTVGRRQLTSTATDERTARRNQQRHKGSGPKTAGL